MTRPTRIYTAFTSERLSGSSQTYSLHHPQKKVLSNAEILDALKSRCKDVDFVGSTEREAAAYTVGTVAASSGSLDGVLYFGAPPRELTEIDLPIVAVYPLWSQWQYPLNAYRGKRMLTGTVPVIPDVSTELFSGRLDGIARKVQLIQMTAWMKDLRILCVTDEPVLGLYEPTAVQMAAEGRVLYEERYLANLSALGAEIIVRPQAEMVAKLEAVPEGEALEVAKRWIAGAESVKGTNETEIRKSAQLYLALRSMMDEYGANAVTTEGYGVFMNYPAGPIPSQGFPSSQFCTDGVVATSETLLDSLVTQQLGLWLTGSTGFNGDYIVDVENGKAYVGHCECPLNPYGDERRVPYVIRNLPQWPVDQQEIGGACAQVRLPDDEPVTVAKVGVHEKKLSLFTGRTVPGEGLFEGWDDILCRTKVAIDARADALFADLDWRSFGNHRVVFYGDYRREFRELATVLGYETVEKDA